MQAVRVKNGTNAGWRIVREAAKDWLCPKCVMESTPAPVEQSIRRGYWTKCPTCGTPRPTSGDPK